MCAMDVKWCRFLIVGMLFIPTKGQTSNICPERSSGRCSCSLVTTSIFACSDCSTEEILQELLQINASSITAFSICRFAQSVIFPTRLITESFPNLQNISVINSQVESLQEFPPNGLVKNVRLTGLLLGSVDEEIFRPLKNLQLLDLRKNRITHLGESTVQWMRNIATVYIQDNLWDCSLDLNWINGLNETNIKDLQDLTCSEPFTGKPVGTIAKIISDMNQNCTENCNCTLANVVWDHWKRGGPMVPVIEVNCSYRSLQNLPRKLPTNTTRVLLQGNYIEDLRGLLSSSYRTVIDVYLDGNFVHNIDVLEGSSWLTKFRALSLKDNKLTQLPTYALDNALQRNTNAASIFLGNNPWRCDCLFTPGFQELLSKYKNIIKDIDNVTCPLLKGDENSLKRIVQISRTSVCRAELEEDGLAISALDLLNGFLATLIILILGKLAYDYYKFKRSGQLPWIVVKMP